MEIFLVAGVGAVALGVFAIVLGRRKSAAAAHARATWTATTGRVVELQPRDSRRGRRDPTSRPWLHPVVDFALPDGREVRVESLTGGIPAPAKVGEAVPVIYDPADPERMMVDQGMARPGTTGTGFVVLGVLMTVVGLMIAGMWALIVLVLKIPV